MVEVSPNQDHSTIFMKWIFRVLIPVAILTEILYTWFYFQTPVWQTLISVGALALTLVSLIAGYWFYQRGRYVIAGYAILLVGILGYGGPILAWSGMDLSFALGGMLFLLLAGTLALPHHWDRWGLLTLLFGLYCWLISRFEPLPRYDAGELSLLQAYIPILSLFVLVIAIWQIAHIFQTGNIRTRLLIAFTAVVLLTAGVVTGVSVYISYQNGRQEVINQLEANAVLKESQIKTWLEGLHTDLSVLANQNATLLPTQVVLRTEAIRETKKQELRDSFRQMITLTGRYDEIFLLDPAGFVLVSTRPGQEGKRYQYQPFFQFPQREGLAGNRGRYVQPPSASPVGGNISITIGQAIFNPVDDAFIGVLAGRASISRLNEIMTQRPGDTQSFESYLVGTNFALLTESRFAGYEPLETTVRTEGARTAVDQHTNGSGTYDDYRGVPIIGIYRWLPELRIALLAEQDQAEALQPVYTTLLYNIGIALGTIGVAILVGLFMTRFIAVPLAELANTATQIAGGDLNLRTDIERTDEIGDLAHAFNRMTDQLRDLIGSLEERVQERIRALETSAIISRQLATILEVDQLMRQVVTSIQQAFDYYHVHIYLIDPNSGELVMREGTGEVGQKLKQAGHRLEPGEGIVGSVAQNGEAILVENVDDYPFFVRNPLLPKTMAELAVPLRKGDEVLGVLDAQSEKAGGFTQEDLTLMQSIADQVAVALDNARLFHEARQAAAEAEELTRRLIQDTWRDIDRQAEAAGYIFSRSGLAPVSTEWLPVMGQAVRHKELAQDGQEKTCLAIPLTLRDELIGVIGIERPPDRPWTEDELITVQSVTEQIALALDSARLARQTERSAWRDQVVSESTAQVWSSVQLDEVMRIAVTQLGDKLKASEVVLRLGTETELTEDIS